MTRRWQKHSVTTLFLDCTSFALIERLDIRRACAFDKHCHIVRLGWPR
jgi:predicted nucleic acid-binding protein